MQMREAAEKILFAQSLDEKLHLVPERVDDTEPGKAVVVPDAPGRPDELKMTIKGVKANFPGINRMGEDRERGKMMHFLANHELLAAELMALVLLKFPDAPKEYRAGVYEAMREEQMHTLMYMRRMKDCGIYFGELPVNDYFWKLIAPVQTPMDFVTRLNLTFEQSNLDFSKHYAGLFREVGDTGTAAVLEKIYLDEIGHVGHGVKWFRKWKSEGDSDWQAFKKSLSFPLAPAKAKGIAPFNAEGRRLAGFDDDFIRHLEVCEQSRGRPPVLHWFNPNAESHMLAKVNQVLYAPNKIECALERDLEMLMLACCRRDDLVLLRSMPSNAHLARLQAMGFDLPEVVEINDSGDSLTDRKLGGLRPWAWSPDASEVLGPLSKDVSSKVPWQWRESLPPVYLSKEIGVQLSERLGLSSDVGEYCSDSGAAWVKIQSFLVKGDALLKTCYACAGRGHRRVTSTCDEVDVKRWLAKVIASQGGVVVESWLDRQLDFSSLYEMSQSGEAKFIGMTEIENDAAGRFLGTKVYPKWGAGLDPSIAEFLFREADVIDWYRSKIPLALSELLPGYVGPIGVDAMVYRRANGELALRHVVEINVRMTMGRVALELQRKSKSGCWGRLRLLRKKQLQPTELHSLKNHTDMAEGVLLNDPDNALEFLVHWQVT